MPPAGVAHEQEQRVLPPEVTFAKAKVVEHDLGTTSNNNPQVAIGFEYEGPDGKKHRAASYLVFTPETVSNQWGVCHRLRCLGWDPDERKWAMEELAAKSPENPIGSALVGRDALITVSHERIEQGEKRGQMRAVVRIDNPTGGGLGMKDRCENVGEIRSVADKIRAIAGSGGGPAPAPSSQASRAPAAAPGSKSPLPF